MNNNPGKYPTRPVGGRLFGGFQRFARTVVPKSGHPMAFGLTIGVILIWALTGPLFRFGTIVSQSAAPDAPPSE